jgi:hypothetical protein
VEEYECGGAVVTISVIVGECDGSGRLIGSRLFDERYPTLEEAMRVGKHKCADGMSVIVRPNYNEKDSRGDFFREWRSFNGDAFKECKWYF